MKVAGVTSRSARLEVYMDFEGVLLAKDNGNTCAVRRRGHFILGVSGPTTMGGGAGEDSTSTIEI